MLAVRRYLANSSFCGSLLARSFSAITYSQFGLPSKVLEYKPESTATSPGLNQVAVTVSHAPVLVEDARTIRGISLINNHRGIAGSTAVGKVSGTNEYVLVTNTPAWSKIIVANNSSVHKLDGISSVEDVTAVPAFLSAWAIFKQIKNLKEGDSIIQMDSETAVGHAIIQIAKLHKINIISVTPKEILDDEKNFINNIRQKSSNVKSAISGSSGKFLHSLLKVIPHQGELIVYNGIFQSLDALAGVDIPISRAIFQGIKINGFDFNSWIKNHPSEFQQGLKEVLQLLRDKKISLKPSIHQANDFQKAINDTESTGKLNVLKF